MLRATTLLLIFSLGACGDSHGPVDGATDTATADTGTTDTGATDAGEDTAPPDAGDCLATTSSDLPGVRIEMDEAARCRFTLAEAAAGISIPYAVSIEEPLTVTTHPFNSCSMPGSSGLDVFAQLSGGMESYCRCDVGLCPGIEPTVELVAGVYPGAFAWTGRNWGGPSDTGMPMGDPFPPGRYTLRLHATGTFDGADYLVETTFPIELIP